MNRRGTARYLSLQTTPRRAAAPRAFILPPRRHFNAQALWLPPVMFVGLLGALWVWKCIMMVIFQNKIIYMPGMPPNARRERIADYASRCGGVRWEERRVKAADGTDLALCVARVEATGAAPATSPAAAATPVYVLYFQGNASSLPPRLEDLSWVLRDLQTRAPRARYTVVGLSYRGYWTSRGRPSEKGINIDAQAALAYVSSLHREEYPTADAPKPVLVLWGQSIGSGIATNLAAWDGFPAGTRLHGLVLETVFTSVRDMLGAVYPPRWVPYRHLWPFLRNHLDSLANLERIATRTGGGAPRITIVEAGKDELVPAEHGERLLRRGVGLGLPIEKKTVAGAFHNDVLFKKEGRKAVADAIERAVLDEEKRGREV
ncbi:Alpha/Beta hydrolase protein [Plectosphaerella cucumerina]|uniref:Alpha/Beta hydrolase protein n=1 Tax=Plectosphaerella cucumerina TaxID=40658 RepID=A0A8K0TRN4_9PEZI|nr:Alpha/Beta hydrolase protein [Plectosphaerella cucumerina]